MRILVAEDSLTTRTLVRNLVTARASADDRVRGMQAGTDAYVTRGDFRQSELLDTRYRLLGRGANLARTPEAA